MVRVNSDNKARHNRSKLGGGEIDGGKVDDEVGKKDQKMSKSKKLFKSKKTLESNFFTPRARLAFTELRQAFVKAPILYYFDLEYHIWVEMDILDYTIGGVFS